jgi:transcriptional regulator with XRE-family HTH domain
MKKIKKSEMGERIRTARIEALLTQQEVANLLGFKTDRSVAHMESGRQDLTITQMHKLARVLRVDPIWLVFGIKQEPPQKTHVIESRWLKFGKE